MMPDLEHFVRAALSRCGIPEASNALVREVEAAGGLAFVSRETLADAGIPRPLRALVLDALTDTDDVRSTRDLLAREATHLAPALRDALQAMLADADPASRTAQAIFIFGSVLRHAVAYLLGPLLDQPRDATDALRPLSRPTYGHLWAAAKLLADHPKLSEHPVASAIQELEQLSAPPALGEGRLVTRMLAMRNSIAHGSRALAAHEWRAREPALLQALHMLVTHSGFHGAAPLDARVVDVGPDGTTGVLEGWDARAQKLHFVGATSDWCRDEPERWRPWQMVLERAGLATIPLERLTLAHLQARALSSHPPWCATGPLLPLTRDDLLGSPLHAGVDTVPVRLRARDPSLAVAALVEAARKTSDLPHLVLPREAASLGKTPSILISEALGLSPGLADAELTPTVATALGSLTVLVLDPEPDAEARWLPLLEQLPGMKVWLIEPSALPGSLPELDHLAPALYDKLRLRHQKAGLPKWKNLSPGARNCRWTVARAWTFANRPSLLPRKDAGPVETLLHMMSDSLRELGRGHAAELIADGLLAGTIAETSELTTALAAVDLLHLTERGASFADEDGKLAAELFVLRHGTQRVARAVLSKAGPAAEIETARLRESVLASRAWSERVRATTAERLALALVDGKTIEATAEPAELLEAAHALARWKLASHAGRMLSLIANTYPAHAREAACLARTIADVDTAEQLLSMFHDDLQMAHQLAGLLRDRKRPGDADAAEAIYTRVLSDPRLSPEQRVWSLCGLAENLVHRGDGSGALQTLDQARVAAVHGAPHLEAMIDHRFAFAHAEALAWHAALPFSRRALDGLGSREDALAARVLDTHGQVLDGLDDTVGALDAAERSLRIKRRLHDRRGMQISLLLVSRLRQVQRHGDAVAPAREALLLAEGARDDDGIERAHRRLAAALRNQDPTAAAHHRAKADAMGHPPRHRSNA